MVGIVIVAHSAGLAEGVRELAGQMVRGRVRIAAAGGIDDPEHPFGTDAVRIQQAIESVYSDEGVLVLMDMGSALLSADMALEFLDEGQRAGVHLCEAPLVEGAVAAAVRAGAGGDLEQVAIEARGALAAKAAQLRAEAPDVSPPAPDAPTAPAEIRLTLRNRQGLHARPAVRFVGKAAEFRSEITVRNATRGTGPANAESINGVMALGARRGHEIVIAATGPDADPALTALRELVEDNFGEREAPTEAPLEGRSADAVHLAGNERIGIPASPGIAVGPAVRYRQPAPRASARTVDDPEAEWERLHGAIQAAAREVQALRMRTAVRAGESEAAIFDAHLLFLKDPALIDAARQRILTDRTNAEAAWQAAMDGTIDGYRALDDPVLQARIADVADVRDRVLKLLTDTPPSAFEMAQSAILVAPDLTPSDIARLHPDRVLGICTSLGGATSHSSILARALGIPAVVGLGPAILQVPDGTPLALDGQAGRVWVEPEDAAAFREKRAAWLAARQAARTAVQGPAATADGRRIEVVANIGGTADARTALSCGAEGVGVLRTEFLYLDRATAPSEAEQVAAYRAIAGVLGERLLVIRTLDVGGDKYVPYLDLPEEANPFLGNRGLRLSLDHPDLFKTQLRAILRASPGHGIKIMLPMVSSVEEVRRAREILAGVQAELDREGIPYDGSMEMGIMVEVPSAVAVADRLAAEVDFLSIGTNDLSQYTMAADRTNARVADLADALHPAVLRLVRRAVRAGHAAGIPVGLCGELAGDPLAAPILLGLGLDELSMNPQSIPAVKGAISRLTVAGAEAVAGAALNLDSAEAVRRHLSECAGAEEQP